MYTYNAKVIRVIDGDTVELDIDLGFTIHWKSSCRLYGVNTPELKSSDKDERLKALEAKNFLIQELPVGSDVTINSKKLDKYGRPLVEVINNHINIYQMNINQILAKEYII